MPAGSYVLAAALPGFTTRRLAVRVEANRAAEPLAVDLQPEAYRDEITVTATPGRAVALEDVPERVNVIAEEEIALRAKTVLAQAVNEEKGLQLQRTSPTIAGVFVRGLTGTKVNVYVDGCATRPRPAGRRQHVLQHGGHRGPRGHRGGEGPVERRVRLRRARGHRADPDPRAGLQPLRPAGLRQLERELRQRGRELRLGPRRALRAPTFGLVATLAGRRVNTLRPGGGVDSHNAVTRFFDLPSSVVIGDRLPDTAFTQYGGQLRANWAITPTAQLSASYVRGQQDGGKRYDQLLGGDGNLVADLRNLMADHLYARFEKARAGFLDRLSLTYSFSAQREERVNQGGNGNPLASVNHEPERTVANGLQAAGHRAAGRHDLTLGGDVFFEEIAAPSFSANPTSGATTVRRGRVPDGPRYRHGGVFVQDAFEALPGRLRLNGAVRFSAASYEVAAADVSSGGQPLWPADSYDTSAFTFRAGALVTVAGPVSLAANVSSGFRAPDVTDLGTFGLTGSGFEVSNREVEGLGATVGTTADAAAVSTGSAVLVLAPETSLSYELTLRVRSRRVRFDVTGFQTDIDQNIAKQSLILPPGAVGLSLAGEPVTRQLPSGVVYVGVSNNPVLVRTNFDQARIRGLEATLDAQLGSSFTLGGTLTWLRAEDRATGLPPNIEGGTPAPDGWLRLRYAPHGGRRFWVEPYLHAAGQQDRLSTLDLGDRRTGASRSRSSIASFFTNGARARGLVSSGPDGVAGNADDVLLPTGETLAQVQARVLPDGTATSLLRRPRVRRLRRARRGSLRDAPRGPRRLREHRGRELPGHLVGRGRPRARRLPALRPAVLRPGARERGRGILK